MSGETQRANRWTATIEGYTTAITAIRWTHHRADELLGIVVNGDAAPQSTVGMWQPFALHPR